MSGKRVLYISGSLGLGHITRDLAIARELRSQFPEVELSWLAAHPANMLIEESGEVLHPESKTYANDNVTAENAAEEGFQLNLLKYLAKAIGDWKQNVAAFEKAVKAENFDLIIAEMMR